MEVPDPTPSQLRERLEQVMHRDRRRISRTLDDRRRVPDLARVEAEVAAAEQKVAARRASVPEISYPEHLPVSQVRDEIAAAIGDHQVVVLAGETGSGKTTQLPKILLELGRGVTGLIGHTQPRRIAARAVAERVAEELGTDLGDLVGYTVRFHDQVAEGSLVKVMTDGILLAELSRDRTLSSYDTIVIDEAHERSLTIDFLLGYLKQLLPRRPDLKVVITSATIDPERFSRHFDDAPILEVSGRTYPVEVRYRPLVALDGEEEQDQVSGIVAACEELAAEGRGDVLVFLSGEREIRDTADALRAAVDDRTEVLPLYGRLSAAEQHRVFALHTGRRIVLATNVAETSLTVPGIRYVVDPGTARISRYSNRTKVQRLPIEAISQASATQRAGRCGRVADGICIRLYSEEDFEARPEFTEPEILRTSLASVLLQMASLGLGDIEDFPFVEPPDKRNVRDGIQLLEELGALHDARLTKVGRQLAQLPIDPRMARMVVEAEKLGCVREVLVITAALSIQDPRERPVDKQQQAAQMHARFVDPTSDLLAWLNLWRHIQEQQRVLSSSAFRRMCRREFLNYLRIREWQDLHGQLKRVSRQLDLAHDSGNADPAVVTQALLAGLLSHVGVRDAAAREYVGARGARFAVVPGSALFKKPPQFVVAAELVETNRLWGRMLGRIEPEWAEQVGAHLVKRTYSEPHWEKKRGSVVAYERVTLYGVPLVTQRKVNYGRIDPVVSRDLFLRHALVEGDWDTHHAFFARNQALVEDVAELEHRARRRDIVVDEEDVYDFYEKRVPADVVSAAHFDGWWKKERHVRPDLLDLRVEDLIRGDVDPGEHPDVWVSEDLRLPLSYEFEPGSAIDGVTVDVPLSVLNRVFAEDFAWQVPGLRLELVTALIKTLPKPLRVKLVPSPDTAKQLLERLSPREEHLLQALSREARSLRGVVVPVEEWGLDRVPAHLRPTFRVVDDNGAAVAEGKDLEALKTSLAKPVQAAIASVAGDLEVSGLTSWSIGEVPGEVSAGPVVGYPALVDEGTSVALRVLPTPSPAVHHAGVRRLLLFACPSPVKAVSGRLNNRAKLTLAANPHGSLTALMDDCVAAAVDALMTSDPRTAAVFEALLPSVRGGLPEQVLSVLKGVEEVLGLAAEVDAVLATVVHPSASQAVRDVRAQRDSLVYKGFVTEVGAARLADLSRYLRGALVRLEKLPRDAERDRSLMAGVHEVETEWARLPEGPGREKIRWMLQELRISLFAQTLKAKGPVSVQRIYRALDDLS
ncbi:MAG: ATP-dependent helicase HrpA [Frankiales bacterium]|nr:ATP-dependent helicase HrpA [Frankiales bacterium]